MDYNNLYNLADWNKTIFVFVNNFVNNNTGDFPYVLKIISHLFSIYSFAIIYILICLIYCYNLLKEKYNFEQFHTSINLLLNIGTCYTVLVLTFTIIKFTANMPRPYCSLEQSLFYTILDTTKERCLSSFPSAHTGIALISMYYFPVNFKWQYRISFYLLALLAILSRITLAMHYPADIIYTIILTSLIIKITQIVFNKIKNSYLIFINKFIFDRFIRPQYKI
ncbi:MAG: phosphatase PAP2 family protein [Rickettsiaceae bacterium]|nr:phosphatase PAP2 family protein [Rickettsiaceae bacterium]